MSPFSLFIQGLGTAFMPKTMLYISVGLIGGIIGGAIPGITGSIVMTLMLPFLYGVSPMLTLPMLASVYVGSEYGGSIPSILIKTPGTGAAAATVLDGYEMQKKGRGGAALCMSLYAGVLGGLVSVIILVFTTIPLSKFALQFGATQYFWLAMMGLSVIGSVSGSNPFKGIISAVFGLFLATIGLDPFSTVPRFTFGSTRLASGLDSLSIMIGLFAVSEVIRQSYSGEMGNSVKTTFKMTYPTKEEFKSCTPIVLACGAMGAVVGALPGAGATIASWIGYSQTKNIVKDGENFGKGDIRGVAAPESANNGCPAGALIPLLALGVPGSNSTAVMMAGFTIAGISCGPLLFTKTPEIPYTLMASMFVSQLLLAVIGFVILRPLVRLCAVRKIYLSTTILLLALVGAFSVLNSVYACWLVLIFAVFGFFMRKIGFAPPATVLGFVLGKLVENNMRRALQISRNTIGIFFKGGLNWVLIVITIVGVAFPYIVNAVKRVANRAK